MAETIKNNSEENNMAIKDIIAARKKQSKVKGPNTGMSWHLDRASKSQEPWEQDYKRKRKGLAAASPATRRRVSAKGGRAHKRR